MKLSGWTVVVAVLLFAAEPGQAQFEDVGRIGGGLGAPPPPGGRTIALDMQPPPPYGPRGDLDANDIPLGEVLRALEAEFRVAITPRPEVALTLPVMIALRNVTLEQALQYVLMPFGLETRPESVCD